MGRSKQLSVNDETLIAALLSNGSQKAAAAAVGVDPRTIYNRMQDGEFMALYKAAKADILRQTVAALAAQTTAAVDIIAEIMTDKAVNAAVRLQAAQTILNSSSRYNEHLQTAENVAAAQAESNLWPIPNYSDD